MKTCQTLLVSTAIVAALSGHATAQQKHFEVDNQKNKYRNIASIESVADFETFTGKTNEVSGSFFYDPTTKKGGGKIVVDPSAIDTGIPLRNEHMKSEGWLDTKYLTNPATAVVLNPPANEPVASGTIWGEANGTCNGRANY